MFFRDTYCNRIAMYLATLKYNINNTRKTSQGKGCLNIKYFG